MYRYVHLQYVQCDGDMFRTEVEARLKIVDDFFRCGSWRKTALIEPYKEAGINYATLRRYAKGHKIINPEHRKVLGIVYTKEQELCTDCGRFHKVNKTCGDKSNRSPRFAIYKDIAHLDNTIQSMTNQMDRRVLAVLVWRLARELGYTLEVNDE